VGIASGDIEAATTAAVREAPNGRDFVRRVLDGTGIALRVVPGEEEADLVALAQERSFPQGEAWLVLDVGGGSTELALRTPGATRWARSLPTGSVKLGDRYGSDVAQLEAASWATVPELLAEAPPAEAMFVGVAGTVTTALQLTRGWTTWDPARLLGARLELDELRATRDRMAALPAWDRRRVPGLHPGRADYVVAGLTLLLVILERLGRRHLLVSDRGVRYGLLWKRWSKATL
jgi:exopolyphosphatase/guanosine-5'-triphosphate,3'-diphosphate pyrophosphatase